ncbi:hypothetical protein PO909_002290, partial [Leuciscus waleckii]
SLSLSQITIKRSPLLYVVNIIIPVCFFLALDLISFFIDSDASDKVTFKVTLLLSVSVMLLILANTLPSTGKEIPLIGVFCCVIFFLIGISILETILVNYLSIKGAEKRSVETKAAVTGQDVGVIDQQNPPDSVRDQNEEKTPLYWTRVARIINITFLVLYIITIIVFMSKLWAFWYHP